jgi:hypothetical protein
MRTTALPRWNASAATRSSTVISPGFSELG